MHELFFVEEVGGDYHEVVSVCSGAQLEDLWVSFVQFEVGGGAVHKHGGDCNNYQK